MKNFTLLISLILTLISGSTAMAISDTNADNNEVSCPADFQAYFTFRSDDDCTFRVTGFPDTTPTTPLTYTWTVNNTSTYSTGSSNVFLYESADNLSHLRLTVTTLGGTATECESTFALDMTSYTCENTTFNGPADIVVSKEAYHHGDTEHSSVLYLGQSFEWVITAVSQIDFNGFTFQEIFPTDIPECPFIYEGTNRVFHNGSAYRRKYRCRKL